MDQLLRNAAALGCVFMLQQQTMQQDAIALQVLRKRLRKGRRRPRRYWVRPWLQAERRLLYGHYTRLLNELRMEDTTAFFNFLRVTPEFFDELLQRLAPRLTKDDTNARRALEPGLKLACTIRHLAAGDRYPSLSYSFRVARETICKFIPEVCQAIVDEYANEVIQCPTTEQEWRAIAEEYERRWNVPHVMGALDGKHVALRKPENSGSLYHNYKHFFSVVLMALVDANYRFLWIDTGAQGHMSDAQIYNASELKETVESGQIGFPPPEPMTNDNQNMPYFMIGDDAFALRTHMMKPYSRKNLNRTERIYNYRISRARRVVENAFGILAARFQCLLGTLQQQPDVVRNIIETCVCLHNLIGIRHPAMHHGQLDTEDTDHNIIPGEWRNMAPMHEVPTQRGPFRDTAEAKAQRETLRLYFNNPLGGAVPWQERMI
nr:putative nuclease HARBI1 [Lytechinus pictus]